MRQGRPVDSKLLAEVVKYEENLQKTGQGSFKAAQLSSNMLLNDSDSSFDASDEERSKFERHETPVIVEEVEDDGQESKNLDLADEIGLECGPIGVILTPPDKDLKEREISEGQDA